MFHAALLNVPSRRNAVSADMVGGIICKLSFLSRGTYELFHPAHKKVTVKTLICI